MEIFRKHRAKSLFFIWLLTADLIRCARADNIIKAPRQNLTTASPTKDCKERPDASDNDAVGGQNFAGMTRRPKTVRPNPSVSNSTVEHGPLVGSSQEYPRFQPHNDTDNSGDPGEFLLSVNAKSRMGDNPCNKDQVSAEWQSMFTQTTYPTRIDISSVPYSEHDDEASKHGEKSKDSPSEGTLDARSPLPPDPYYGDPLDENLSFTCHGRCGQEISFPCGCSPVCVVYGTCCDGMDHDCPRVLQEGRSRFSHLLGVDFLCHEKDYVSKIVSCPMPMEKQKTDIMSPLLREHNFLGHEKSLMRSNSNESTAFSSPSTNIYSKGTAIDKLNKALVLSAPVTDVASGFTFINKSIYDCNRMSSGSFHLWTLQLEYTFKTPVSLDDVEPLLGEDNRYFPVFDRQILIAHLCRPDVIRVCNITLNPEHWTRDYEKKCQNSTAIVSSNFLARKFFANKFCAYCNEGRHEKFNLDVVNQVYIKSPALQILVSLSASSDFNLKMVNVGSVKSDISWISAECSILDAPTDQTRDLMDSKTQSAQSVCVARCKKGIFALSASGMCTARHSFMAAVADDGLPGICPSALPRLANFLTCGLKHLSLNLRSSGLRVDTISAQFDNLNNKVLYVLKLFIDLPATSNTWRWTDQIFEFMNNFNYFAILAKAFKLYRLSYDLCREKVPGVEYSRSTVETIKTLSIDNGGRIYGFLPHFFNGTRRLQDTEVGEMNTYTVCFTFIYVHDPELDPPFSLICADDMAFEREIEAFDSLRQSGCYDLLNNTYNSGGNSVSGSNDIFTWLQRTALIVVLLININIFVLFSMENQA